MATRIRSPKKNNSNLLPLFIVCISEFTRFSPFKDGPEIHEVKDLLLTVYRRDIPINEVIETFEYSKVNRLVEMVGGKLILTDRGKKYLSIAEKIIIPPQTVAQPQKGITP